MYIKNKYHINLNKNGDNEMKNGKLYLIATPIGNLEDITFRAVNILKSVDIIAAEDTRQSLKLLNHLKISKKLISYHRHNEEIKTSELIDLLKKGKNIGLITDAGTPGISDPGELIVKEAIKEEIEIIPIPGACAAINAIIVSGLSTKEFIFYGFLPQNKKLRQEKFEDILNQKKTIIIYEAPHRLLSTLREIRERCGDIYIVIAKEITKIHENFIRGKIDKIIDDIQKECESSIKGEFIIMFEVNAASHKEKIIEKISAMKEEEQFEYYQAQGLDKKEIIKQIAKNKKVNKNVVYKMFLDK